MTIDSRVEELLSQSDKWVDSLDRAPIGLMAVPHGLLSIRDAMRQTRESGDGMRIRDKVTKAFTELYDTGIIGNAPGNISRIVGEMNFWRAREGSTHASVNAPARLHAERLDALMEKPFLHDYFVAGVFDIPFIEQCIDEGIDPDMAISILKSV